MPVSSPGFSERVFEFAFNSEYANANRALLAAVPYIPTQNDERLLGYDVEFQLKSRGAIRSLALQHKTCRFVDGAAGSNREFWAAAGGPYFAFRIDVDQYNLIAGAVAAKVPHTEFYYCAPMFSTLSDLNLHYMKRSVMSHAVWLDISAAGPIRDHSAHTIVCSQDGSRAFLFSVVARELKIIRPEQRKRDEKSERVLQIKDLQDTYDAAFKVVDEYWSRRMQEQEPHATEILRLPRWRPTREETETYEQVVTATRGLLADYYGLSWLVEVHA